MKKVKLLMAALCMSSIMSITSFAGQWQQNETGWWYQNDDGTYPSNTWQWIDGNEDGISEYYYFDQNGYCLINGVTPDGHTVDSNGAWIVDGAVQTMPASYNTVEFSDYFYDNSGTSASTDSSNAALTTKDIPEETTAVSVTATVWVSRTGKKYHSSPSCSNMKSPLKYSLEDAIAMGRTPCSKCY